MASKLQASKGWCGAHILSMSSCRSLSHARCWLWHPHGDGITALRWVVSVILRWRVLKNIEYLHLCAPAYPCMCWTGNFTAWIEIRVWGVQVLGFGLFHRALPQSVLYQSQCRAARKGYKFA